MLKGKKTLYILIPLNIFIWGFFIYRFIEAFNDSDLPNIGESQSSAKIATLGDSAIYALSLDYKDPFLKGTESGGNHLVRNANEQKIKTSAIAPVKTPTVVPQKAPDIKYLGLVKNSSSGAATALINLNGQSRLIKANEAVEGIVFKSFDNDCLVARWGKEKLIVKK
jgi:hypothetical protein